MVTIRTLQPSVRIAMPQKQRFRLPSNVKRDAVVRRLKDFPPPTPQDTPCRLWQGSLDQGGYGKRKIQRADGKWEMRSVHRWVMEQSLGRRLRKSEVILHACDQPLCYRLDHLSVGTIASNNADARRKGRAKKPPVNKLRGEANGNNKIPPKLHRGIILRWLNGEYRSDLAREFGVHVGTIERIIRLGEWPVLDRVPPHARAAHAWRERTRQVKEDSELQGRGAEDRSAGGVPADDVPRSGTGGDDGDQRTQAEADQARSVDDDV